MSACLLVTAGAACKSHGKSHKNSRAEGAAGLADATVLIIRHAEKPEEGSGLAPEGERRAKAYVRYFAGLKIGAQPIPPDYLIVAADSPESRRPRLTLKPLGKALALPLDDRYAARDAGALVEELRTAPRGKCILICWHHGEIDRLIGLLGGDAAALLPHSRWPDDVYDWLIVLTYDHEGRLQDARRISEGLMPGDSAN